jgi:hypothetical protein
MTKTAVQNGGSRILTVASHCDAASLAFQKRLLPAEFGGIRDHRAEAPSGIACGAQDTVQLRWCSEVVPAGSALLGARCGFALRDRVSVYHAILLRW